MKIGIYGGTFNPIHYGHLRTAEDVRELLSLDRMIFIPSGRTPFDKPQLAGAGHRFRMVKAAIEDNDAFEASGIEIRASGKSYTVDTLIKLRKKYKKADLYFILGIDAFLDLPQWKQPEKLVSLTNLVVLSRPGYSFADLYPKGISFIEAEAKTPLNSALSRSPYLGTVPVSSLSELDAQRKNVIQFEVSESMRGFLCNVTGIDITSTEVRNCVIAKKSIKYLVPDKVRTYIFSHGLYVQ